MRAKRTIRKPTRWTPDEWRSVEDAARARRLPPLRFVREAVLGAVQTGATAAPPSRRRVGDELVHQLARVLNNLRQLERVADEDDDADTALLCESAARVTEYVIRRAPGRADAAAPLVEELIAAGRALNEVAHRANADEALPPADEVIEAVKQVYAVVRRALR